MLQVRYECGTCGLKIIERQDEQPQHNNKFVQVMEEKKLWHQCADNYVVPLQSYVEKAPELPKILAEENPVEQIKKKANHK